MTTTETTRIDNKADILDSRDIIERIEDLENAGANDRRAEGHEPLPEDWDELGELDTLRRLTDEAEGYSEDWEYGAMLIRDSYFTEYAQELAEDIGAIDRNAKWPNDCIDWERAARELQYDYTSVEFDGVTYWVR